MAENEESKGIVLREVKLYWAKIREPRVEKDKTKYTVEVCCLTREQATALHNAGVTVRKGAELKNPQPEKELFITATSTFQPRVVDASNRKLEGDEIPLMGNGTLANVLIGPYNWVYDGNTGTSAGVNAIQILDLVEYNDFDDVFEAEPKFQKASAETIGAEDDVPF